MSRLDPVWLSKSLTDFVFHTADYAANYMQQIQPLNSTRPFQFKLDCSSAKFRGILSGERRDRPATIIWSSRFSFEVPLLLFRLHTYKDLVDYHFISETQRVDFSSTPKPMMFERVKGHFQDFLPQIVHHVIDDTTYGQPFSWSHTTTTAKTDTWGHENHHFQHILPQLLKTFKDYPADSIVLHGDAGKCPAATSTRRLSNWLQQCDVHRTTCCTLFYAHHPCRVLAATPEGTPPPPLPVNEHANNV